MHAYHGCFKEEELVGAQYEINIRLYGNFEKAAEQDNLLEAVNYVHIFEIIKREMAIRSNLIETVTKRISDAIFNEINQVKKIKLSVAKLHPPLGSEIESFEVIKKTIKNK